MSDFALFLLYLVFGGAFYNSDFSLAVPPFNFFIFIGTKNPGAAGEGHDFIDGKVDSRLVSSCVTDLMHALNVQPIQTCSVLID